MGIAIAKTFFDHDTVYQCMVAPKLFPPGRPFVEGIDNVGLLRSPNIRMFFSGEKMEPAVDPML